MSKEAARACRYKQLFGKRIKKADSMMLTATSQVPKKSKKSGDFKQASGRLIQTWYSQTDLFDQVQMPGKYAKILACGHKPLKAKTDFTKPGSKGSELDSPIQLA